MKKILLVLTLFSHVVYADSTLIMKTVSGDAENEIYIKDGQLRFVMKSNKKVQRISLFSQAQKKLVMLNKNNKTFFVIDKRVIKAQKAFMAQRLKMLYAQTTKQMEFLPEADREKAESFLSKINPATGEMKRPNIQFKPLGKFAKVGKYICERVNVFVDNELSKELCLADDKALKMDKKDFSVLKDFFSFMKESNGQQDDNIPNLKGIPIATKALKGQKSSGLESVNYEELNEDLFKVPAQYKQVQIN
jgi:hypothetical protein